MGKTIAKSKKWHQKWKNSAKREKEEFANLFAMKGKNSIMRGKFKKINEQAAQQQTGKCGYIKRTEEMNVFYASL